MEIVKYLKQHGINTLVFSEKLKNEVFLDVARACGIDCIFGLDTRAAVYLATGICAQSQKPIAVFVDSSSSRSAFSGMTEAYYRRLPILLVTLGKTVDYSVELRDVVVSHYILPEDSKSSDWDTVFSGEMPMHIEIQNYRFDSSKITCSKLQKALSNVLDNKKYLYIGQNIQFDNNDFRCKVVRGGLANCSDGALSNVLGASLAQIRNRYIGLVSEKEFLHDINVLGNINVNDSLLFFVVTTEGTKVICNYAKSLGFEAFERKENELDEKSLQLILFNAIKSVVIVCKE